MTKKTKNYVTFLRNFNVENVKSTLVLNDFDKNVVLSSRNLQNASVKMVSLLNTFDVLNSDNLLITESGLIGLVNRFN